MGHPYFSELKKGEGSLFDGAHTVNFLMKMYLAQSRSAMSFNYTRHVVVKNFILYTIKNLFTVVFCYKHVLIFTLLGYVT